MLGNFLVNYEGLFDLINIPIISSIVKGFSATFALEFAAIRVRYKV